MRICITLLFAIFFVPPSGLAQSATDLTEYQIKAAFIYNFAKFVNWPDEAFENDTTALTIGIIGDDPFDHYLDDVVRDKRIHGRRVHIVYFVAIKEIRDCHVLFISRSHESWLAGIVVKARKGNMLTIGESKDFLERGGIIRLITVGNKVRFEIEQDIAIKSGLLLSSRLLKLANNLKIRYSHANK